MTLRTHRHGLLAAMLGSAALSTALLLGSPTTALADDASVSDEAKQAVAQEQRDEVADAGASASVTADASDLGVTEQADVLTSDAGEPEAKDPQEPMESLDAGTADATGEDDLGVDGVLQARSDEGDLPEPTDVEAPVVDPSETENAVAQEEEPQQTEGASAIGMVTMEACGAPATKDVPAAATAASATPKGTFALETGLGYGIVVDVKGGSTADRANAQIYRSNDTSAQRWRLEFHGSKCYVVNVKSGKVLDVAGGKATKGANVQLYRANGTNAQLWYPEQLPNGSWVLRSALNKNYVLDVTGGSIKNGTNLRLWTSNGSGAQTFWIRETNANVAGQDRVIDDGTYFITTSLGTGGAIDVRGGSTAKGANVQLYQGNGSNAQRFYVTYVDGYYTFQSVTSGLALDLYGASPVAGANVQMWTVNHSLAQQWSVVSVGDGTYKLINRAGGLVLDLAAGKTANGTNVRGYYGNGSGAQTWLFTATTMLADGFYTIVDTSGNVLDIAGGSTQSGATVQRHAGNGSMAQRFRVDNVGDGEVQIRNVGSAKWVSDSGSAVVQSNVRDTWKLVWNGAGIVLTNGTIYLGFSTAGKATMVTAGKAATIHARAVNLFDPGYYQLKNLVGTVLDTAGETKKTANAVTSVAKDSVSQIWYVTSRGNGTYSLVNLHSGLALEVTSTSKANGVLARQAAYTGANKQLWKVVWDEANGGLVLINAATGLALDVVGGSNLSGAGVQQYQANGSLAQSWHLVDKTVPAMLERIAQVSEHFASHEVHGYSIPNRGCGSKETVTLTDGTKVTITNSDVDCSEMVRQCINAALGSTLISYLDTRVEDTILKALGFVRMVFDAAKVKRGDILWVYGHTGVYVGDGKQADAHQDENGNLTGPLKGDQTSHEVEVRNLRTTWTYIYRYVA